MGTSSIFRGNNDKNRLLPEDYVEQLQSGNSDVTWKSVKTAMSKYVSSNGSHGSPNHVIKQAIKANGGAHRMAINSVAGMRAARNLGNFLSSVRENGLFITFQQLGVQYNGKSSTEVFSQLINIIAPVASSKEDIVARQASQAALSNVYEYVEENNMDFECLDHMPIEMMDIAMKAFLSEYIWNSIIKDLESRVEQYMEDVSSACQREEELKDVITAVVDIEYDSNGSLITSNVNEAVMLLTERCLGVLEGIV